MSDPIIPFPHPDERLAAAMAAYVTGDASPAERRRVEAHLESCEPCRREIGLASGARAALRRLPEPRVPDGRIVVPPGTATPRRRPRPLIAAAVATAAVVIGLIGALLATQLGHSPAPLQGAAAPRVLPTQQAPSSLQLRHSGVDYDPSGLAALAGRLAAVSTKAQAPSAEMAPNGRLSDAASGPGAASDIACLREALRLGWSARPVYLEEARFRGRPALIGGFVPAGEHRGPAIVVGAASLDCVPLGRASA